MVRVLLALTLAALCACTATPIPLPHDDGWTSASSDANGTPGSDGTDSIDAPGAPSGDGTVKNDACDLGPDGGLDGAADGLADGPSWDSDGLDVGLAPDWELTDGP